MLWLAEVGFQQWMIGHHCLMLTLFVVKYFDLVPRFLSVSGFFDFSTFC